MNKVNNNYARYLTNSYRDDGKGVSIMRNNFLNAFSSVPDLDTEEELLFDQYTANNPGALKEMISAVMYLKNLNILASKVIINSIPYSIYDDSTKSLSTDHSIKFFKSQVCKYQFAYGITIEQAFRLTYYEWLGVLKGSDNALHLGKLWASDLELCRISFFENPVNNEIRTHRNPNRALHTLSKTYLSNIVQVIETNDSFRNELIINLFKQLVYVHNTSQKSVEHIMSRIMHCFTIKSTLNYADVKLSSNYLTNIVESVIESEAASTLHRSKLETAILPYFNSNSEFIFEVDKCYIYISNDSMSKLYMYNLIESTGSTRHPLPKIPCSTTGTGMSLNSERLKTSSHVTVHLNTEIYKIITSGNLSNLSNLPIIINLSGTKSKNSNMHLYINAILHIVAAGTLDYNYNSSTLDNYSKTIRDFLCDLDFSNADFGYKEIVQTIEKYFPLLNENARLILRYALYTPAVKDNSLSIKEMGELFVDNLSTNSAIQANNAPKVKAPVKMVDKLVDYDDDDLDYSIPPITKPPTPNPPGTQPKVSSVSDKKVSINSNETALNTPENSTVNIHLQSSTVLNIQSVKTPIVTIKLK